MFGTEQEYKEYQQLKRQQKLRKEQAKQIEGYLEMSAISSVADYHTREALSYLLKRIKKLEAS